MLRSLQRLGGLNCFYSERQGMRMKREPPLSDREIEAAYSRNIDAVYRVCFSFMKNRADAEDLAQEASEAH